MNTTFDISLQATLLSNTDKKYLITSTGEYDIPIAIIVDENVKNALMDINALFKSKSAFLTHCLRKHVKSIVYGVHMFEDAAAASTPPPDWALKPLIGITNAIPSPDEDPTMYEVEYVQVGEAVRYIRGYVDPYLYAVIKYIAKDYSANPALYYYVLTNCISKFKKHIDKEMI